MNGVERRGRRSTADEAFLANIRSIAEEVAGVFADEVDADARFPAETLAALREVRALSALVPQELGGGGVTLSAVAQACFELGRRCSSAAMVFAMHQIQVGAIARHLDDSPWFEGYLRELADGQRLIASATSEVGTGGDMGRSIAALTPLEDGRLAFEKQAPTVSYGAHCDDFLTTLRRSPTADASDQVFVLHRFSETQLEPLGTWDTIGMRGTCSPGFVVRAQILPEQVMATPFARLMEESLVPLPPILWSHVWLGIATEALERGRSFVRAAARRCPGTPVPAAHALARVMPELVSLRSEVSAGLQEFIVASDALDRESLSTVASLLRFNNLKLAASEQAPRICQQVLEAIGIMAYKNDSPYGVGRQLRDALSARVMVSNERLAALDANLLMIAKDV